MKNLFSLGDFYVSNFIPIGDDVDSKKYPLNLVLDENGSVKLDIVPPLNIMYGKYWYRSGITNIMKNELKNIVDSINSVLTVNKNDLWVDIACNDGTLLSYVNPEIIRVGIDPADDSYKKESIKHTDLIIQDYFSFEIFQKSKFKNKKAKVITTIAMFYDLENPESFIQDVYKLLDDNGLWVIQMSYTPLMLEQLAFDNICHEHVYYYSLFNLKKIMNKNGFDVVDTQINDINGGSFRLYLMKTNSNKNNFSTQPYRDVCNFRIKSILAYEEKLNLDKKETWDKFFRQINLLKEKTVSFIKEEKRKGKTIWGYGASTKGNTLLQYFGLDNKLIDGIAEKSPYKFGMKTVGSNIPIFSEEEMRKIKPDYLLILPWHFISEFKQREKEYFLGGGKFIVPCPKFEIVGL
jgi:2-polyprenyl-3-methyl-5-hydroxy-6-metoxy-1,4-benzoquinol methylase